MIKMMQESPGHGYDHKEYKITVHEDGNLDVPEKTLKVLREDLGYNQETLAELLGMHQATLSKIENRSDMFISTLKNFVENMGGKVSIVVTLGCATPDTVGQRVVKIAHLGIKERKPSYIPKG